MTIFTSNLTVTLFVNVNVIIELVVNTLTLKAFMQLLVYYSNYKITIIDEL